MAEPFDVFQPQQAPDLQGAAAEWTEALQDPKVKASLLSFGLQAMQPMAFGQTTMGHLGQAIGAGGETVGRVEAMDRAEEESDAKVNLAEARGLASEARATTARAGNDAAAERNRIAAERLGLARTSEVNRRAVGILQEYNKDSVDYRDKAAKEVFLNPKATPAPFPSLEEWAARKGQGYLDIVRGISAGGAVPGAPVAPPAPAAAAVPASPADRTPGRVYPTPMGPLRWTGTGWVAP